MELIIYFEYLVFLAQDFQSKPRDFLRRNFAPKRVVMVKPSMCDIIAIADSSRPQRSTPYFSVSQQQIAYRRERSPK